MAKNRKPKRKGAREIEEKMMKVQFFRAKALGHLQMIQQEDTKENVPLKWYEQWIPFYTIHKQGARLPWYYLVQMHILRVVHFLFFRKKALQPTNLQPQHG